MSEVIFDGLRLIVEPAVASVKGAFYGTIFGGSLYGTTLVDDKFQKDERVVWESIIWGIAEHALRAFVGAVLYSQTASNKKMVDRGIILISGCLGVKHMLETRSVGVIGLGFTAGIFLLKLI